MKLKSLYVTRFLLEMIGIFLVILAVFVLWLTPKGFHGEHPHMRWVGAMILLLAIGLLVPPIWAKFSSSLFLLGTGAWIFHTDAYWRDNLGIYPLFVAPLALTFWLHAGFNDLNIQRLPNGN